MTRTHLIAAVAATFALATPVLAEPTVLGPLQIDAPFLRATLPNQPVAGGFMTITNTGDTADTLVAATSPVATRVEVHAMAMDGDVMRMRELVDGLPLPAGETVTLAPGGYHIMFMDLAGPLVAGELAEVTLTFENAGDVTLTAPIVDLRAGGMGHGSQMDHMNHEGDDG